MKSHFFEKGGGHCADGHVQQLRDLIAPKSPLKAAEEAMGVEYLMQLAIITCACLSCPRCLSRYCNITSSGEVEKLQAGTETSHKQGRIHTPAREDYC